MSAVLCCAVLSRSVLSTRINELLNEFFHLLSSCGYCEKRLVVKPKILSLLAVLEVSLQLARSYCDGQGSLMCCRRGVTKNRTWLSDQTELIVKLQVKQEKVYRTVGLFLKDLVSLILMF